MMLDGRATARGGTGPSWAQWGMVLVVLAFLLGCTAENGDEQETLQTGSPEATAGAATPVMTACARELVSGERLESSLDGVVLSGERQGSTLVLSVRNEGDRPVRMGSEYEFQRWDSATARWTQGPNYDFTGGEHGMDPGDETAAFPAEGLRAGECYLVRKHVTALGEPERDITVEMRFRWG